jgi:hypothetical protein
MAMTVIMMMVIINSITEVSNKHIAPTNNKLKFAPGHVERKLERSRCSDKVQAGRQRGRTSSLGKGKILYSTSFRPVPEPTQHLSIGYRGLFSQGSEIDRPLISNYEEIKKHGLSNTSSWRNA